MVVICGRVKRASFAPDGPHLLRQREPSPAGGAYVPAPFVGIYAAFKDSKMTECPGRNITTVSIICTVSPAAPTFGPAFLEVQAPPGEDAG